MQPSRTLAGAAMLVFTTLVWGAMFSVAKGTLHAIDAFWLTTWRYVPASLTMLALLVIVEGRRALAPEGAAGRLWLFGSLGFAGFSMLGYLGLARSRPEHAAIIVALMPLFTTLANWLVRGAKPSRATLVATLVALAGTVLVITKGRLHGVIDGTLFADALVLAGMLCWIGYTMGAATMPRFSTLRYTALSMALGATTIIGVTGVATLAGIADPPALTTVAGHGIEVVYLSLVAGVLAVFAWNAGVAALGASNGVLFINLVPITAFAIGIAQGHRFGPSEIAGALLVIGALVGSNVALRAPAARSPKFA
ncbi:MAG TPA: DMT family transporter [Casimicrobiaceae bacterium]|jgi:drug/metabolite transporter (DMT)-like permease|nr:DMT family transporter [Casimicrobiaceae bacterium]